MSTESLFLSSPPPFRAYLGQNLMRLQKLVQGPKLAQCSLMDLPAHAVKGRRRRFGAHLFKLRVADKAAKSLELSGKVIDGELNHIERNLDVHSVH